MSDERIEYLSSGSGDRPHDHERLDLIRAILAEEAIWAEPPPEVGDAVIEAIRRDPGPDVEVSSPGRRRWPRVAGVAGAAALVAVAIGLFGILGDEPGQIVVAVEGTELESEASGEATLRPTGDGWWIRLEVSDLGPAPEGTYYEGWVWSDEGHGVSIGTFHLRGDGDAVILWSGVDPRAYPSIWVTLEEEDGDPAASDRLVLRGRIPGSG